MDSKSFCERIKAVKKLLDANSGCGKLSETCLAFVKESIDFLKDTNASATQNKVVFTASDKVMRDWYPVFGRSLQILHECRGETGLNVEMVLSYINHVLIHLVSLKEVPLDWFRCLGLINLEFLHFYSLCPSHKSEYLSSLIQKSHQCMRIAAQRASGDKSSKNTGGYFQLLIVACSYLILEEAPVAEKQQDILTSCKGYISNFLQICVRTGEESGFVNEAAKEEASVLFKLCCVFYCLRGLMTGPLPQTEKDACFFKELFRVVHHIPPFRDKLVSCQGDFSSLITDIGMGLTMDGFHLESLHGSIVGNTKDLQESLAENKAFQFAASVCHVVHILIQISEGPSSKDYSQQLNTELESSTDYLHSIFAEHPSPGSRLPQHVGEIVSVLSECAIGESFKALSPASSSALHDFLSLCLDVLIRDVICYSGSPSSELPNSIVSLVSHRSYSMAVVNRLRMALLQSQLLHSDMDNPDNANQVGVSGRLKCSLNLLCTLVKKIKKGSGLSTNSSAYRTIFKTLKNAVCSLGGLCRLLRRSEKYDVIIAVAGPLWPVANLPEMLSHVSHHESLCEAYRVRGDVQSACQVVVQASALGGHLVTQGLLKSILKIAKTEASLKIPVLFARCPEETGVAVLLSLVRLMSASSFTSQSLTKHQKTILRHLSASSLPCMSTSEKVLVKLLLAEVCWYCPEAGGTNQEKPASNSDDPLNLLQECTELEADVKFQDLKAQAILLAAEIRHAVACLKVGEASRTGKQDGSDSNKHDKMKKNDKPTSFDSSSSATPENSNSAANINNTSSSGCLNMAPPTALEAVFDTPVTHSVYRGKKSKNAGRAKGCVNKTNTAPVQPSSALIFPIWEDSNAGLESQKNDDDVVDISGEDSVELMDAAVKSWDVWMEWYSNFDVAASTPVSMSDQDKEGKAVGYVDAATMASALDFRVDRSLAFLQHLVSLALAHDKPLFAIDCLKHAKELASKLHRPIVAEHIHFTLLSLLGQLGLDQEMADIEEGPSHLTDKKGSQHASVEDILSKFELGQQGEPSHLVPIAAYLFHTDKVRESVRVQKSALANIENVREKECLTPALTLQFSELKCLMVECSRTVAVQDIYQEEEMPGQHPLQAVCDALKYITSLKSYFTGKTDHILTIKGTSVDSWQMIYCYLNTLYLGGKVFLQAGMVKSACTYLQEGLKMAVSCRLSTWSALFKTALANISINYSDSVLEASRHLEEVSKFVSSITTTSYADVDLSSVDSVLASLSAVMEDVAMDTSLSSSLMDESVTSPVHFSPKLSTFQVYRMWLEAEVALQLDPPDFPRAIHHLSNAKHFASTLLNTRVNLSNVQNMKRSVINWELLIVETLLRLGQAFLFLLADKCKGCELPQNSCEGISMLPGSSSGAAWSEEDVDKIKGSLLNLLESIIHKGKRLSYCYEGKVVVATAQLLKIHSSFLTPSMVKQKSQGEDLGMDDKGKGFLWDEEGDDDKNDTDVWMDCDDEDDGYEAMCIAKEVKELKLEEEYWNERQKQRIMNEMTSTTESSLSSNGVGVRSPCRDNTSKVLNTDLCTSTSTTHPGTTLSKSSPSSSSPTKRSSPSLEDEENFVPPTPPKVSKENISSSVQRKGSDKGRFRIEDMATPIAFLSPVNHTTAKAKRGGRGAAGRGQSKTKVSVVAAAASKVLHFDVRDSNDMESSNESQDKGEEDVGLISAPGVSSPVRKGAKPKVGGRGRRGKTRNVKTRDGDDVSISNSIPSPGEVGISAGNHSGLSPLTDQLGKLNINRKSVSPVKRKSGEGVSEIASVPGLKEEEMVTESRSGVGRRGRGRGKTTSVRSSVASRKKSKVTCVEDDVNSTEVKSHQESATESEEPEAKVNKRKARSTTSSSNPSKADTKAAGVGRGTRRTRRNQPEQEQSPAGEGEPGDCPLEVQRGASEVCAGTFSPHTSESFSSSPIQCASTDGDSIIDDPFISTPSDSNFHDIESPIREGSPFSSLISNTNTNMNFDIFSTPLRQLHLNSPIEIPRGKPVRKTATATADKRPKQSGKVNSQKTEASIVDSGVASTIELSRGLDDDDDDDQENETVNQVSASSTRKTVGTTRKGKLSLRKNTKRTTASILCDSDEANNAGKVFGNVDEIHGQLLKDEIALKSEAFTDDDCFSGVKKVTGKIEGKKTVPRGKRSVSKGEVLQKTSVKKREVMRKNTTGAAATPSKAPSVGRDQIPEFFSTTDFVMDNELLQDAVESLRQLSSFPPSHTFNHLSKATAMLLTNDLSSVHSKDTQASIAAHLSNSMHVTFQHMLNKNLISKLRVKKSTEKQPGSNPDARMSEEDLEAVEKERAVMKDVLNDSFLQWPVETSLMDRLAIIPKDWVVVQMAVVSLDLFRHSSAPCQVMITRLSSDCPPLTFPLSLDRWKEFTRAKRVLQTAIVHNVEGMTPEKYWTYRFKNDQDVKNLLYFLQEKFLSGHKWLLSGRLTRLATDKKMANALSKAAAKLVALMKQQREGHEVVMDGAGVKAILEILLIANEKDVDSLLRSVWSSKKDLCDLVKSEIFELQKELLPLLNGSVWQGKEDKKETKPEGDSTMERGPVVLILDKQFNDIPWESMPVLQSDNMSRVPSLAALEALLRLHQHRPDSVFLEGVGRRNVMAVIDPETNLENSVKLLQPQYEQYTGWKCQTQQALTVSALKDYLSQELYIYSGHGWGRQFVAGDELQMFRAKAVAVIMGCNSGRMEYGRMKDSQGPPLYFLLAGCPAVVGNLWVVTDKDIDKLTSRLCHAWMTSKGQRSLGHLLNQARQACKLVGLNGFAPVVYGLPIKMN